MKEIEINIAPYFKDSRVVILCNICGQNDFDLEHVHPEVYDWYKEEGVHTEYFGEIQKVLIAE